jgi:hypothetical protein
MGLEVVFFFCAVVGLRRERGRERRQKWFTSEVSALNDIDKAPTLVTGVLLSPKYATPFRVTLLNLILLSGQAPSLCYASCNDLPTDIKLYQRYNYERFYFFQI